MKCIALRRDFYQTEVSNVTYPMLMFVSVYHNSGLLLRLTISNCLNFLKSKVNVNNDLYMSINVKKTMALIDGWKTGRIDETMPSVVTEPM